jgi:hypothetical protein
MALSIKTIPCSDSILRQTNRSRHTLLRYDHPYVKKANSEILKKLGVNNYHDLHTYSMALQEALTHAMSQKNSIQESQILFSPHFRPVDYITQPYLFAAIHVAISKFHGLNALRDKNVLQIAPNWGPYMHFLHNRYGANTYGVDTNYIAVDYAQQGKLKDFRLGDVSKMDFFRDNFFDLVISLNFLDPSYLQIFCNEKAGPFMEKVLTEVHRVLKPGKFFISQEEEIESLSSVNLFSSFSSMAHPCPGPVSILQK